MVWFCLFVKWHIKFHGLFNAKTSIIEKKNISGIIYPWAKGLEEVYSLPDGISPKMDVIARLEFELTYYDVSVQYVSH